MITPLRDLAAVFTVAFMLASAGCSARPLTQLVVVTESSLDIPSDLDQIEIDITSPSGAMGQRMVAIASRANLPATLGVVHRDGPLGPVHIRVRGLARGMVMVTREADVMLQEGRTLRLDLPLDASCRGVVCPGDQSCAAGACRMLTIAPSELVDFNGTPHSSADAGSADAGSVDAGSVDAGSVDAGSVDAGSVDAGWVDAGSVDAGWVDAGSVDAGWVDAASADAASTDAASTDAASTDAPTPPMCPTSCSDPMHATGVCEMGICVLVCRPNRSDCNGLYDDGCETDIRSSETHCGVCARACGAGQRCRGGDCG